MWPCPRQSGSREAETQSPKGALPMLHDIVLAFVFLTLMIVPALVVMQSNG